MQPGPPPPPGWVQPQQAAGGPWVPPPGSYPGAPPPNNGYPQGPEGYPPPGAYQYSAAGPSSGYNKMEQQQQHQPYYSNDGKPPAAAGMGYTPPPPQAYQQQQQQQQQQYGQAAGAPQPPPAADAMDLESGMSSAMAFAETRVRNGFVRKVFGIVTVQLLITVGFSLACLYVTDIRVYVNRNQWPFWLAWGLAIGLMLTLVCVSKARRTYPLNMILLGLFTVAQAFLVGMITSRFNIEVVMLAFLVTAAAVGGLTLFAINTKVDATKWGSMLAVAGFAFIALVLIGIFWINKIVYLVISGVAALLFSAYLIYDIQLLMGGRTYSISPDEYVFAALTIYLDIINIFLALLQIIGFASNN